MIFDKCVRILSSWNVVDQRGRTCTHTLYIMFEYIYFHCGASWNHRSNVWEKVLLTQIDWFMFKRQQVGPAQTTVEDQVMLLKQSNTEKPKSEIVKNILIPCQTNSGSYIPSELHFDAAAEVSSWETFWREVASSSIDCYFSDTLDLMVRWNDELLASEVALMLGVHR